MTFIIGWIVSGIVVFWLMSDYPAHSSTADNTQLKIDSKALRVLLRISMLLFGPAWVIVAILTAIWMILEWAYKTFWRKFTR